MMVRAHHLAINLMWGEHVDGVPIGRRGHRGSDRGHRLGEEQTGAGETRHTHEFVDTHPSFLRISGPPQNFGERITESEKQCQMESARQRSLIAAKTTPLPKNSLGCYTENSLS